MWSKNSMFYIISLQGDTLPYSSFLIASGHVDFWHPYQHNKYVIVQYSTMDNQIFLQSIIKGDFNLKFTLT